MRVRQLRLARGWSQAQLAERSGLSVRTIQRVENGANPGLESLRSLAAALEVDLSELQDPAAFRPESLSMRASVVRSLRHFDDFSGRAGRAEFWWSALALVLALSLAGTIGPELQAAAAVVMLLPAAAVGARRLRDAGHSPWWLLIAFAPVGGLVALAALWAMPSVDAPVAEESTPATTP